MVMAMVFVIITKSILRHQKLYNLGSCLVFVPLITRALCSWPRLDFIGDHYRDQMIIVVASCVVRT